MNDVTYYFLAFILIAALTAVEVVCAQEFRKKLKERSAERTEQRRAATRLRIYKEVHDSWTKDRNRRNLWNTIYK
jgi:hypothetical protein